MSIITLDFETYYDKEYSLSKMTTEEYIRDDRFEVIGVGVKVDDQESVWYSGKDVAYVLKNLDWSDHAILCHNTLFDGAILAWRYGIKPGMWFDTLSMARAVHGVEAGGSLKALAERYALGEKGDEVINALGKRLVDFDPVSIERYGAYCRNDVDLTYRLFDCLSPRIPDDEFRLIDLTVRMFTEPSLRVDDALLVERLEQVRADKAEMLSGLMQELNCDTEEAVRKQLCSNPQFAELLRKYGITPPVKLSPTTGKETYAFAKTDPEFIELQEHDDPTIQQLCGVRLGTKSTLEESRIGRFIGIGGRNRGYLPVPLRYYGAHTGRWSGLDSVNFQNLPSRDKAKKALKNAIVPPDGHIVINCDSSQIEARVLAWLAEQESLVAQFANGEDVYSTFASEVYKRPISEANPTERFVGKTCILGLGYGTGAKKLQQTLKQGGAALTEAECKDIVALYRGLNYRIPELWGDCDAALRQMLYSESAHIRIGRTNSNGINAVWVDTDTGIQLPNGLYIRYPKLRLHEERMIYDSRRGPVNIWGGAMVENIVQALARIIVGHQMLRVAERYSVALTVHDAVVCVVSEAEKDAALQWIIECMSIPPDWAEGLPVACKAKWGHTYGEC
jgi:DNA polymerase